MKKEEYEIKSGDKKGEMGVRYKLELGDEVVARFDELLEVKSSFEKNGKPIVNHLLGVTYKGEDITVQLTGGQAKVLKKHTDLQGKTITTKEYEVDVKNEDGTSFKKKCVGVRVK